MNSVGSRIDISVVDNVSLQWNYSAHCPHRRNLVGHSLDRLVEIVLEIKTRLSSSTTMFNRLI